MATSGVERDYNQEKTSENHFQDQNQNMLNQWMLTSFYTLYWYSKAWNQDKSES